LSTEAVRWLVSIEDQSSHHVVIIMLWKLGIRRSIQHAVTLRPLAGSGGRTVDHRRDGGDGLWSALMVDVEDMNTIRAISTDGLPLSTAVEDGLRRCKRAATNLTRRRSSP
jgi:hypothetical protein